MIVLSVKTDERDHRIQRPPDQPCDPWLAPPPRVGSRRCLPPVPPLQPGDAEVMRSTETVARARAP